ncbi:alpha/beta fold hydrolase [Peribacillus cavernae]|uniref:Alpha/beta fold hydrolase n=1 Tax=Peribacillus cavernae TaxID=1674310 RepID=A0A433HRJ0_9BACI|nr:alpha/beta fold hydrolase [Peribacillus cavernae]MDQ0218646.1 pimeloyl-ACP methyl ester carboxylesterase [Peribacillus cavernae]RUQ30874.1 alpha/beta fold hydrolase [Peribacillus cavernae]
MGYVDSNGIKVHYNVKGTGEPIVFLHSLGAKSELWDQQVEYFQDNYKVITIDARGHGKTDSCIPFKVEDCAYDVKAILDYLDIDKAHIVGISMGGHMALELYQMVPERIKSITLSNTFAKIPDHIREEKMNARLKLLEQDNFVQEWARISVHEGADYQLIDHTIGLYGCSKEDYKSAWIEINHVDFSDMLNTVDLPVLVMTGDKDYIAPVKLAQFLQENIKKSRLDLISNAGHLANLSNPKEFNEKVASFLAEVNLSLQT